MDENIITFNVTNMITICIMAGIGLSLVAFGMNWWTTKQQATAAAA
jgi:hypothetical protein